MNESAAEAVKAAIVLFANKQEFLPDVLKDRWADACANFKTETIRQARDYFLLTRNFLPTLAEFVARCRDAESPRKKDAEWEAHKATYRASLKKTKAAQ